MDANRATVRNASTRSSALLTQGFVHVGASLLVIGGLVLIGAWDTNTDESLVHYLAVISGFLGGLILSHIIHEWCHYIGAVVSRAKVSLKPKAHPLFFEFDIPGNSSAQFLYLSVGGLMGNVLLIASLAMLPAIASIVLTAMLAAAVGQFVFVIVLELPVSLQVLAGKEPMKALTDHFSQGGSLFLRAALLGVLTAAVVFLMQ